MRENGKLNLDLLADCDLTPELRRRRPIKEIKTREIKIVFPKPEKVKPEPAPKAPLPERPDDLGEDVELRPIPEHDNYFADSNGDIWSIALGYWHKLSQSIDKDGYLQVRWSKKLKCNHENFKCQNKMTAHRLVLLAFHGTPPETNMECLHGNGIKTDNRPDNLKWGTSLENSRDQIRHGTQPKGERVGTAKLNEESVREIRRLWDENVNYKEIAKLFQIHPCYVWSIAKKIRWNHVS